MPKLQKQRRGKQYNYNANRKRMNKKAQKTGKLKCPEVQGAWEKQKTVHSNFRSMGIVDDPNKTLAIPSATEQRINLLKVSQKSKPGKAKQPKKKAPKSFVVDNLETNANLPRESGFRFSKDQQEFVGHLLDKYKLDYKAMVRDSKNYYQETWKQLRSKIRRFLNIQEHVDNYLKSRGIEKLSLEESSDEDSE